jgi:hypothetical protein
MGNSARQLLQLRVRDGLIRRAPPDPAERLWSSGVDRAPQVRDDDGAAHDQGHGEGLEELVVGDAFLLAADHVVGDAVVAAEHHRGDEPQQLLGLHGERAGLVGSGCPARRSA